MTPRGDLEILSRSIWTRSQENSCTEEYSLRYREIMPGALPTSY